MTPHEARRLTLRDAFQVVRGYTHKAKVEGGAEVQARLHNEMREHATRLVSVLCAVTANFGGMSQPKRPLKPSDFLEGESKRKGGGMSRERLKANYEHHEQRQKRNE